MDKAAGRLVPLPAEARESVREIVGRRDPELLAWLDEAGCLGTETFTRIQSLLMDEVLDSMGPDHSPTERSMFVERLGDVVFEHKARLLGQQGV